MNNKLSLFAIRKMATAEISAIRIKYMEKKDVFTEASIEKKEPTDLFKKWMTDALNEPTILEPNGMCLATVNKNGFPSARYILMKGYDEKGFTFFTNYSSRKAIEMEENPNVAATIYWLPLRRSVRIEGRVEKIPQSESEAYFHTRPRASQIGAVASPQSQVIPSREHLDKIESDIKEELGQDAIVPMPNWGGYLIVPRSIEFWQGQTNRLHDRIRFRKDFAEDEIDGKLVHRGLDGWVYERLAP